MLLEEKSSKFIEDFLNANPQDPLFSEVALNLRDFIKAFLLLKNEGDAPSKDNQELNLRSYQTCLLITFCERTNDCLKWKN